MPPFGRRLSALRSGRPFSPARLRGGGRPETAICPTGVPFRATICDSVTVSYGFVGGISAASARRTANGRGVSGWSAQALLSPGARFALWFIFRRVCFRMALCRNVCRHFVRRRRSGSGSRRRAGRALRVRSGRAVRWGRRMAGRTAASSRGFISYGDSPCRAP